VIPNESSTFGRPRRPRDHVPGKVVVRFRPDAVRPHVRAPRMALNAEGARQLPDSVAEPLDYLRANAGLRSVEPLFSARRRQLARRRLAPADRQRLAVAASVVDVESDARSGLTVLTLPQRRITERLLKDIGASQAVEFAEPLPARWLAAEPDPKRNLQWGLRAIRYFEANRPSARSIRVAVIDSGIDTNHPDLPDPGIYRHSGFRAQDVVGHGTHVAGIIAAKTNNGVGIAGIADCELAIWKVFPDDPNDPYLDSESYLRALGEVVDEQAAVVNLSIGGGAYSDVEAVLFAEANAAGVTVVAAMGNEYEEGNPTSYPAAYDDVVSVGSIAEDRRRSSFSNTGRHIDLLAPGSNILSTLPTSRSAQRRETDYASWSGTSMATPHVTAAAALLLAAHPGWSPAQVARRLRSAASPVAEMGGKRWTEAHGSGLLNLKAALSSSR
jgi:subtilisin family serine protease